MAENKLVQLNFENSSYSVSSIVFMHSALHGQILMSDLVVANLFVLSFRYMIQLYLAVFF